MPQSLVFHPLLVLRNPVLPFSTPVSRETVSEKLRDAFFQEALYLASPDLYRHAALISGEDQPKDSKESRESRPIYTSLLNYLNRMRSRSTPFGLFAACTLVPWGKGMDLTLGSVCRRHTRLDMHYVCNLAQALARLKPVQDNLLYYPNSSYYLAGDQVRYLEYRYENGQRMHQYTSVYASEPLKVILMNSRSGLSQAGLYDLVKTPALKPGEVKAFIAELIESQVLVSELEPVLTGEEFFSRVRQVMTRIQQAQPQAQVARLLGVLEKVARHLNELDARQQARPADYEKISAMLPHLEPHVDKNKLFQVDLIRPVVAGSVPQNIRQELLHFLPYYKKLTAAPENTRLSTFRRKFRARYEDRSMPLLEVLDPDVGIGYGTPGQAGFQPLVEDLVLPAPAGGDRLPPAPANEAELFLYRQVRTAAQKNQTILELDLEALAGLPENQAPLPPSLAVIFKMPGAGQIHLEAITGPSAVNLISRFGHADAGFQDLACTITAREEAHNPGVLFAEIVHLPEKRTGNILLRPHLRSFEIPYLAASGLPQARQIPLQDLYLRVAGDRIVLFSRELNQEIIPRLDTAHLYTAASLPVYLFLCDLQTQGLQAELALSWQPHRFDVTYLPRLTCGNFILGLATWQLNRPDYALLLEASPHTLMTAFEQFKQQWGLPEQFTFGEGDRDLLVDSCNPDTIAAWVHTIRQRSGITLREHLYDVSQSVVKDEAGQPYAAQFIGTLINQEAVYAPGAPLPRIREPEAQQEFPPGSEWLYYKIYGGAQSAETVLTEALTPLTEELRQMNLVDQWFFLRYQDPDPHIRLRLHLLAPEQIGAVISRVYQCLRPYQETGLVWQTQIATYQRETGRYGAQGIKLAEELFFADSLAITGFLSRRPEAGEDQRWTWALAAIDQMLTCFQYTLNQKSQLISNLKAVFAGEFKLNKDLKLGLDKKYRHYRPLIQQDWEGYRLAHQAPYQGESLALLGSAARQLLARASQGQLEVPLDELLSSFIHLHVNRLIPAQARLHELVLYDFLFRHYQMLLAREKQKPLISFPR